MPTPPEVGKEISEVRKQLLEKADAAEQAYNEGYGLLDQYRYGETRPYLQLVGAVPLPDLSLALGQAYRRCGEVAFETAKRTCREDGGPSAGRGDREGED